MDSTLIDSRLGWFIIALTILLFVERIILAESSTNNYIDILCHSPGEIPFVWVDERN